MGFGIAFDSSCNEVRPGTLVGGTPSRLLRLSPRGGEALLELRGGTVRTAAGATLARKLFDAGLAHPVPPGVRSTVRHGAPLSERPDLTVVVPAHGRTDLLAACLRSLGNRFPVLVVDDASADGNAVAKVAAEHGAQLIRRQINGGPAAARNTGLAHVDTDLVAFVDSDAVPTVDDLERIAAHLADPAVAAAAPRILPTTALTSAHPHCVRSSVGYSSLLSGRKGCALDLGGRPAQVAPFTKVAYVPSTVLVVRRELAGFDEALRYGEDVDLIWRLHEAGHRVRYDPSVSVGHHEPATQRKLLVRRFRYGTSAAPLSRRHPGTFVPLALEPFTAAAVAATLAGKPRIAAVVLAVGLFDEILMRRQVGLPASGAPKAVAARTVRTWRSTGTYAAQLAGPALVVAATNPRLVGSPSPAAVLRFATWVLAEPLARRRNPVAHLADDLAYGAGVLAGCWRERTAAPLKPLVRRTRRRTP
ncbi:MAG: mycofactocin biosynthesis glycosyltransferase MftF [Sporichthyaceae bacterium]